METPDLSAKALGTKLKVNAKKWNKTASEKIIKKTIEAAQKRGIKTIIAENKNEALEKLKELIPAGAEVMNGSSTTLNEIGFTDYLKRGEHGWKNLHEQTIAEQDKSKQADLRRKAVTAEYFLSSVNAIAMTGELVATDASGSRVGAFAFGAKNLVIVCGANKIVPTLQDAFRRIQEYAFPLEDSRAKAVYGFGSRLGKTVVMQNEMFQGRTTLILVKESLGY